MHSPSVAIVGSETLLGKDVRELIRERGLEVRVQLIGADEEETGKITEEGDEAVVITPLDKTNLASADVVVLTGSAASSRKAWELTGAGKAPVVDVTRALDDLPPARIRAPHAERGVVEGGGSPLIVAHPAAVALAMFFGQLEGKFGVRRSLVEIFEPASERGQQGIDELHQQTVRLFSFQSLPKEIFDAQLAFALLARFGVESPHSLELMETAVERHLASLLAGRASRTPMPSLRLVQAPVFHGYSISAWVELEEEAGEEAVLGALAADRIDIRAAAEDAPTNVGAAGTDGIIVGNVRRDRNIRRAFWFWIVTDNLRMSAGNAVELVKQICAV
ncbi:MAG: hypothetical protein IT167_11525 [Bryobacterales bacterium]|nr:hypothetical protein [Bryobacterales bacterium]